MRQSKILVADDRPDDAALLTDILTSVNYDVVVAYDGEDALQKAYSEKPALVILDIRMPKVDGYEVCRRLKSDPSMQSIPVIMLTSTYRDSMDKMKGFEVGADDYLTQPVGHKELLARIAAVLRVKSLYDERVRQQEELERITTELQRTNEALTSANAELVRLAVTDPLTGLYTRQHFFERLEAEIGRSRRFKHSLAIVRVNIDDFKQVNRLFGQPAGDAVLRGVANTLRQVVRSMDVAGRVAGDEFVFLLPETNLDGVRHAAVRMQDAIAKQKFVPDQDCKVTISQGLAALNVEAFESADSIMARAEGALQRARAAGGNCVVAVEQ